ncbi:dipeptide/oligopeptide/nickel ABC transporter permease/ATP-binding protein [Actinomadura parmotrematis]|uniref:Dipeptide/oligopeptide/nickel ABC transporter permease/ATP-binding protein n=1 Tax=Actinomadura parmotrematis TaxID=2864039 RepID=A0ABS7G3B5_9ACTN|nr:dipeptide/oligopeptide/nickel ABC transporter permease/ATP-binding protein [Actinomadura parmotrematis]MBW8487207.1 dipeptide/oligopeptide/nickel ABC transporter permease/ATP-binding protein [Actinomadura parmotrematis]
MIRWTKRPAAGLAAGLAGLALIAAVGIAAPLVWGEDAGRLTGAAREGMSAAHLLGTDALGRDVLARTLVATRLTLALTLLATLIAGTLGIGLGTAVWVSGPRIREIGLRLIDVMVSYPAVILALVVAAVLGAGGGAAVVAIGVAWSPSFARLTANLAASVAGRDHVATARLMGVPPLRILTRHLLPNIAEPLLVLLSVCFAGTLTALSGLSFIGLGVQPPSYDWGALLDTGLDAVYTNPGEALGPALAITLTGVLAGFVGDGLAASADPRRARAARRAAAPEPAPRAPAPGVPADALLVVDDLRVALPDGVELVAGVSFAVRRGEIVGVVGESGSGKSLTAMAVAKLLPEQVHATAAALRLADLDLTAPAAPARLATEIGVVYQDPATSFNPGLRMGGQITEALRRHRRVGRADARRRAVRALTSVRVTSPEHRLAQHPHELSGGLRQRAMIASAVLTEPRLLIADEPTTALDVTVQAEVLALLREINERDGTAMLFISHDIGVIAALCHRVLVMYAGRIVEELAVGDLRRGRTRHPYTRALLAATPRLTGPAGEPPATVPGRPPEPGARPAGCAFAARCPRVLPHCADEAPPQVPSDGGGWAACHALRPEPAESAR